MKKLFILITILFFSFNNANAELSEIAKGERNALLKGQIIFTSEEVAEDGVRTQRFVVRYEGHIYRCMVDNRGYYCIQKKYE